MDQDTFFKLCFITVLGFQYHPKNQPVIDIEAMRLAITVANQATALLFPED